MARRLNRTPLRYHEDSPVPGLVNDRRFIVDKHELPNLHSTFSANAEVATSTVHARGKLDLLTVDLLWGTIDVLIRAGHYHVTLDLADVASIDAAGVKLLVALQHSLATHAGELTIINSQPAVWDALHRGQVAASPVLTVRGQ